MSEVWFYHLERTSLEQALPELLEKVLARGWKGQVRLRDAARVEALDQHLWTWRDDSFLPHGPAGEPHAARQLILLTTDAENVNGAEALLLVDGAEPGDLAGYERVMVLFDGNDEAALATARAQWSALKARGENLSYWRQEGRGWKKQ
jgi:DNA polymerase-3 subunit chi